MKLEKVMLSEIRQTTKTNTRFFHLHEVLIAIKFRYRKSNGSQWWGEGKMAS